MLNDFNLLKHLHALLSERNVSRAAEKMAMTQSAMSRSFAKLKIELQDPLMVRVNNQYALTERATQLKAQLDQLMPQLSHFGVPESLELASIEREVHLAGTDLDILYVEKGIKKIQKRTLGNFCSVISQTQIFYSTKIECQKDRHWLGIMTYRKKF